jgi:hypothetical protein
MYCTNCGKELENGEICSCQENNQQLNEMPKKKGGWKVVLTAIIYPLIIIALSFVINGFWVYKLFSVLFAVGFSTFMVLGGFYLIIIPLPVVYLFQYGCTKPELPTLKKVLYVLAAIACIALALVFAFL